MVFNAARRIRSSDDIVSQIRDGILSGELKEGHRLPNEREMREQFGVSRATLREALRVLETLGVVDVRPGAAGGSFIAAPDGEQLGSALEALLRFRGATAEELAEFRVPFEVESARWAARRADPEDCAQLMELAQQFVELADNPQIPWPKLVQVDIAFHQAIASASKNQVRAAITLGIHRALHEAESAIGSYASPEVRRKIGEELVSVAAAVAAGDEDAASSRMGSHVQEYSELERSVQAAAAAASEHREGVR
jgi:GntR family transcriptional repressor for pyruvate dehydrogenase complex